jgi:hypothetical protein
VSWATDRGLITALRDKCTCTEAGPACRTRANSPEKSDDEAPMAVRSRLSDKESGRYNRAEQPSDSRCLDEQGPRNVAEVAETV